MNTSTSELTALDSQTLASALQVLQAEQRALEPSPEELTRLRNLRVVTLLLIASPAVLFLLISGERVGDGVALTLFFSALLATGFLVIAALFSFVLNLPLLRKLWRMERLRRRLHIAKLLEPHFRAERMRKRALLYLEVGVAVVTLGLLLVASLVLAIMLVLSVVSADPTMLFVFGWLLIPVALLFAAAKLYASAERRKALPGKLFRVLALVLVVMAFLSLLPLGLGFLSILGFSLAPVIASTVLTLLLVRQGRQRLAVVQRLQARFDPAQTHGKAGAEVSKADYELVARLERGQVMLDRQQSIGQARQQDGPQALAVQRSRQLMADLADLNAISLAKIEREIFRVAVEPEPAAATFEEGSGLYRQSVEDTPYDIVYQVDREAGRIRVFGVRGASGSAPAVEANEL